MLPADAAQLDLFGTPARPVPSQVPEEMVPLGVVVGRFLEKRKTQPAQLRCKVCGCTEANPCRERDGEPCILNERTRTCSATRCRKAA